VTVMIAIAVTSQIPKILQKTVKRRPRVQNQLIQNYFKTKILAQNQVALLTHD